MLVDNCYACCVFCWLISVDFCVAFSFLLCVVYFVIKFIKYNDLFFPSLSRVVNPASRLEGDATDALRAEWRPRSSHPLAYDRERGAVKRQRCSIVDGDYVFHGACKNDTVSGLIV